MSKNIAPDLLEEACKLSWDAANAENPNFKEDSDELTYEEFKAEVKLEVETLIDLGMVKLT